MPHEPKVGCERDDGLLNVHPESQTCEVCEPKVGELPALPETPYAAELVPVYTADHMHAYANAAIQEDRVRRALMAQEIEDDELFQRAGELLESAYGAHDIDDAREYLDVLREELTALEAITITLGQPAEREARKDEARWISVDERLPNDGAVVWIASWAGVERARFMKEGDEFHVDAIHDMTEAQSGVTHWMPYFEPDAPR